MRITAVLGYIVAAFMYLRVWWNPSLGEGLVGWVAFEKLCLTEFLTCHAITLLGAFAMAAEMDPSDQNFKLIFWMIAGFYLVLGGGAYFFHQDTQALMAFYLMLALRASQFLNLRNPDIDVMRAQVVKNFAMFVPMMLLVVAIVLSDDVGNAWQIRFLRSHSTLVQKIWNGKPLLFVTAYYLLWAVVEWKWPASMADK